MPITLEVQGHRPTKMLNNFLARTSSTCKRLSMTALQPARSLLVDRDVTPKAVGISLVKMMEKEEEESLYPTLQQMGVSTQERVHSFSVPCHRVLKFIKLGAINKQISVQYCHYLAQLVRETQEREDKDYYAKHCGDLMAYILRSDKNLPMLTRAALLCDIASTNRQNCQTACSILLAAEKLPPLGTAQFANLFGALLKFGMWTESRQLLQMATHRMMSFRICESLVDGLARAAEELETNQTANPDEREKLRTNVIETIYLFCEISMQYRVQFITKQKKVLHQALTNLGIGVQVNPNIKLSGRCTACNNHLPLLDYRSVKVLNEAIKNQIFKGADKGLFVNTSPNDSGRFEDFLQKMFEQDKRPIDCVVDGLNIAYRSSIGYMHFKRQLSEDVSKTFKIPKPESQAHTLINTIIRGNMLVQFRKILVVGKVHMTKWPGLMDFFRKNNIHFYSSFNNTKDDLFQLYASTLSPKTVFVTNDFLRDHLAQMNESDRTLMERWIDTRQVWICQKSLKPIMPTPYEKIPSVDRAAGCFHLPVIDFDQLEHVGTIDPPPHLNSKALTWFCCNINPVHVESKMTKSKSDLVDDQ